MAKKVLELSSLTGAGSAFCAGMDLTEMQETVKLPNAWQQWQEDSLAYRDLLEKLLQFPKQLLLQ